MSITIAFIFLIFYLFYKLSRKNHNHWKDRNVPYLQPAPFVGNSWKVMTVQVQIGHYLAELYNKFDTRFFGIFIFNKPILIVRCPELMKHILVKDFYNFKNRTASPNENCDSMGSKILFFLKNSEWRFIRQKIAPAFSTMKLRNMIPLMNVVAAEMKDYLEKNKDCILCIKEVATKFITDSIASCAFGIQSNAFKSEDDEFRKMGRLVFDYKWKRGIYQTLYFVYPEIVQFFRISFFDPAFTGFVREIFWEMYNKRKQTGYKRNDLIDTIIEIENKCRNEKDFNFVGDRVPAQACQFFAAGFETTSSTIGFALYELSLQTDIQERVREDIKRSLDGEVTYEALKKMSYLNMVMFETLRKYPTVPFLDRTCYADYKIPNSDLVIEKGTAVYIPIFGLHYDSKYFPDPERFDPDRFSEENKNSFPEFAFLPFGKGPRRCIGERFAFVSSKLAIIQILSKYKVERSDETPVPLEFETKGILLAPKVGLPIQLVKLAT